MGPERCHRGGRHGTDSERIWEWELNESERMNLRGVVGSAGLRCSGTRENFKRNRQAAYTVRGQIKVSSRQSHLTKTEGGP